MKKLLTLVSLLGLTLCASAQTNGTSTNLSTSNPTLIGGLQQIGAAITSATNWTVTAGYGHSLSANGNVAFADVAYNFTENVGVVAGFDDLWGGGKSEFNDIRGGITLSLPMRPFSFLGGTNFFTKLVATPFVADLLATPRAGEAIGNLVVTGAKVDLYDFSHWSLGILGAYEHRMGQGEWNGNYALVGLTVTRKW